MRIMNVFTIDIVSVIRVFPRGSILQRSPSSHSKLRYDQNTAPEIEAAAGIVNIHANISRLPIPHLTADALFAEPTPMIDPDIVWVVLTGIPICAVKASIAAAPVSALNP